MHPIELWLLAAALVVAGAQALAWRDARPRAFRGSRQEA